MTTAPSSGAPAQPPSGAVSAPAAESQNTAMQNTPGLGDDAVSETNWSSEAQFTKSLSKLQELEHKIHTLREFLPRRLLQPLIPISNPNKSSSDHPSNQISRSPEQLRGELDQTARARIADIQQFVDEWRGADMKPIWAYVEGRINEAKDQHVQPSGYWEMCYRTQLEELKQQWATEKEEQEREDEEQQRAQALSSKGEWKDVLEMFLQSDVPGVRVVRGQDDASMAVTLVRAGIVFLVRGVSNADEPGVAQWQTSSQTAPGRLPTNLEKEILGCLDSRPRKWDLAFLLDMLSSYADVKQTPCSKCQQVTNNSAQLPAIRRSEQSTRPAPSNEGLSNFTFIALHPTCT